ncbi:hypothetical protein NDU88_003182 [Pleurodeles waltl]|uniref:Uncharacterized protein n=1 Tax=Pleurodeles waltl TaxID=8319 RepID=A0AAV7T491_PLEWA|nr:hypothetical protein NDU88_003182 [Pleurodeles waltl]
MSGVVNRPTLFRVRIVASAGSALPRARMRIPNGAHCRGVSVLLPGCAHALCGRSQMTRKAATSGHELHLPLRLSHARVPGMFLF